MEEGLIDGNDIIAKYYTLTETEKETINKMIETLYNKKEHFLLFTTFYLVYLLLIYQVDLL